MTSVAVQDRTPTVAALQRFFRTPKGLLTIVLVLLAAVAAPGEGVRLVIPSLLVAVACAALADLPILRARGQGWEFPSGAILTGLIVAMVLSPQEPLYVVACTSAIAVISKYLFRGRTANIFNPAALAIVITFYLFDTAQNWWGALAELPPVAVIVLFATGVFITDRVNKVPLVLAFLGAYFGLFTASAYASEPRVVAEIFRPPDVQAVLFFAFFMLTDPPTAPVKYRSQIVCGIVVAAGAYLVFELSGAAHYLLVGLLFGNIWEAWERRARKLKG